MSEKPDGLLSYINGDKFDQKAPEDLKYAVGDYLRENPLPKKMEDLSEEKAEAFSFIHNEFIKDKPVIPEHIKWHQAYGSGGRIGEGSGEEFLRFHRRMMEDLNKYINKYTQDEQKLPVWDELNTNIAGKFPLATGVELDPQQNLEELANETPSPIELISKSEARLKVPGYLTVEGNGESFELDGREVTSLNDINSVDELGRVMGESWFHANSHEILGKIMSDGFESPRAPQFYGNHGMIYGKLDEYLGVEKGRAWYNSPDADGWKQDEEAAKTMDFAGNFRTQSPTISPAPSVSVAPSPSPTISLPPSLSPSDIPSLPPSMSQVPSEYPTSEPFVQDAPSQAPAALGGVNDSQNMGLIVGVAGGGAAALFLVGMAARVVVNKWTNRVNSERRQQNGVEAQQDDIEMQSHFTR